MSLSTEYDKWHTQVYESDPGHADESSSLYPIIRRLLSPFAHHYFVIARKGSGA